MAAKDRWKCKIVEYLANPENDFPSREYLALDVLGMKHKQHLFRIFTGAELQEIEREALEIRRTKYAASIALVDKGLLRKAAEGDSAAAKLVYQRFDGWAETKKNEHTGKDGEAIKHEHGLSAEARALLDDVYESKKE